MSARRFKPPTPAQLDRAIKEFNHLVDIGDNVELLLDDGSTFKTTTESEAYILGGHSAVILLRGVRGCYSLSRVKPV